MIEKVSTLIFSRQKKILLWTSAPSTLFKSPSTLKITSPTVFLIELGQVLLRSAHNWRSCWAFSGSKHPGQLVAKTPCYPAAFFGHSVQSKRASKWNFGAGEHSPLFFAHFFWLDLSAPDKKLSSIIPYIAVRSSSGTWVPFCLDFGSEIYKILIYFAPTCLHKATNNQCLISGNVATRLIALLIEFADARRASKNSPEQHNLYRHLIGISGHLLFSRN
jgi:hypothetical protein